MKRHPWGKVPTITFKDGLTLYESRPIAKYLASKYATHLLPSPSDLEAVARFDQASSVELIYFNEHANKIGFEKFAKKIMGLPCNEAVVDEAVKGLNSYFDVAEGILGKQEFMVGDQFTLVDIYYIPLIHRLFVCDLGDLLASRKNVNAWWERCMERPAIKKLMQADEEAMKAAMKK
jgi:glutathione S-transferase